MAAPGTIRIMVEVEPVETPELRQLARIRGDLDAMLAESRPARREATPDAVVQLRALMASVGDALDDVRPADADSGHALDHLEEALAAAAEWEATWCAERAGRAG